MEIKAVWLSPTNVMYVTCGNLVFHVLYVLADVMVVEEVAMYLEDVWTAGLSQNIAVPESLLEPSDPNT